MFIYTVFEDYISKYSYFAVKLDNIEHSCRLEQKCITLLSLGIAYLN